MENNRYVETQSFWSRWFFVLFLLLVGVGVFGALREKEWGSEPIIGLSILFLTVVFFAFVRLRTSVDSTGIMVDFKPFLWRKLWTWDKIADVQIKKYTLLDYGGWGYRIGPQGTAYTVQGKYGFQIQFKDGSKVLVGTQKPEEIQQFLDNRRHEQI
ncbi:hypothetical protein M8998_12890 [Sphingobacterium sp. lm-10]|uniref:hypothetical protein n=1 Tax=Sphingobacterium sp. lm-10 TaxID=2944904 RepID=UPI0020213197|nr:hypothetical protein [Sphingobacterium sp. lm-10]MCL7988839.1 hypothetical protein [Sphingobacterium sp. lm-10]